MIRILFDRWCAWRDELVWQRLARAARRRRQCYELITALITALVIINATASGIELGNEAYAAYVKTQLADDIEAMIPVWEESIDARAAAHRLYEGQGITPYRATLERELLKQFAPQARALAARIRDARKGDLARYGLGEVLEQIAAGFGGRYAGGALGKEAGEAIGRLLEWEWNAAAIAENSADMEVKWEAKRDLLRQLMGHLGATQLASWDQAEPLVRARAYRSIRYLALNRDQWSDAAYRQHVYERAVSLARESGLTRAQSDDAPFADYQALMAWLAQEAGKPLPEVQQEPTAEPAPTATLPPAETSVDREAELVRLYNACEAGRAACSQDLCDRTDWSGCAVMCPECFTTALKNTFSERWFGYDPNHGACVLPLAEAYVAAVLDAQSALASGGLSPNEASDAERAARETEEAGVRACLESTCSGFCAQEGKGYDVVGWYCECN